MNLSQEVATSNEWHVLKGESKFGPYTYSEMIQMLQNKTLFNFDSVWSPHLENWTILNDLSEFSPDRLTRLVENKIEVGFNKRRADRVVVSVPVVCNDNLKMWPGTCENISEGGGLILMENPVLLPGHLINIHFKSLNAVEKSFNCTVEILAKRLTQQRIQHDTGLHYAVKFLQILPCGEKQIKNWIKENLKK